MAAATNGRRFTRSRKTTTPDDLTKKPANEPQPRSLRSSKAASTDNALRGNCAVVISKLKPDNTKNTEKEKRQSPERKRARVDNGNRKTKVCIVAFFRVIYEFYLYAGCNNLSVVLSIQNLFIVSLCIEREVKLSGAAHYLGKL